MKMTTLVLICMMLAPLLASCSTMAYAVSGERPNYGGYGLETLAHMPASAYYDSKAQIALLQAAADGDGKAMAQAVKDGADVNGVGRDGMLPLYWAMGKGSLAGTKWLLEHGADPNRETRMPESWRAYLRSPVRLAVWLDNPVFLHTLLEHGGNPNHVPGNPHACLLNSAMTTYRPKNVQLLIKYGANVNHQDEFGGTPLMNALYGQDYDIALMLLQAGADPMLGGDKGESPVVSIIGTDGNGTFRRPAADAAYPKLITELQRRGLIPKDWVYDPQHPLRTWANTGK